VRKITIIMIIIRFFRVFGGFPNENGEAMGKPVEPINEYHASSLSSSLPL
jgi:hypothetical protein